LPILRKSVPVTREMRKALNTRERLVVISRHSLVKARLASSRNCLGDDLGYFFSWCWPTELV
jgi:hypothetical protein